MSLIKETEDYLSNILKELGYEDSAVIIESNVKKFGDFQLDLAMALAKKYHVDMPIIEQVNEVLFENKPAKDAVKELMLRDKKVEHDDLEWQ